MVVVGMLLGTVFCCGKWVRWMVGKGVRCIYITGGEWISGVVHRSGEKKVMFGLIFIHYHIVYLS